MELDEKKAATAPQKSSAAKPEPVLETVPPEPAVSDEALPEGLAREVAALLRQQTVMHMDQIAAELDAPMEELTTVLTELELYGAVERLPGKQFRIL